MTALAGDLLITSAADQLPLVLDALGPGEVELDLSRVDEVDCAGLQLVVLAWHDARRRSVPFRITAASDAVHQALRVVGMHIDTSGDLAPTRTETLS